MQHRLLQDLFNHLRLTDLALAQEYQVSYKSWKPASVANTSNGIASVILRFIAPIQEVIFDVHAYLAIDSTIAASGMLDPKMILFQKRVKLCPGSEIPAALMDERF